ncbi:hypothetical protein PG993_002292 [Apiospora rasikravindrae]|uniref:Uncharacterized protein n=1 Tax=Apiospora rasikravindrae TaxID=990691 RepID=A0ABR1TWF9_9PEZI
MPNGPLRGQSIDCIGRTAKFRVCAHRSLNWTECVRACKRGAFQCDQCDTAINRTTRAVQTRVHLVQGASESSLAGDEGAPFPPYERALSNPSCDRPRKSCPGETARFTDLDLVVLRPIVPTPAPWSSSWLEQRDNTGDSRISDARGITWCPDGACGTSQGRRKEALLFRMLDAAIKAPSFDKLYGGWGSEARAQCNLLRHFFLWFWSPYQRRVERVGRPRRRGRRRRGPRRPVYAGLCRAAARGAAGRVGPEEHRMGDAEEV